MARPVALPTLRRLAGSASLMAIVAFLAALAVVAGGGMIGRSARQSAAISSRAHYYVVVRSALADAAGEVLARAPGVEVVGQRGLAELLPPSATGAGAPDRLRVVELLVALPAVPGDLARSVAALRDVDGVVDVIDLNAEVRDAGAARRARRWFAGGLLLIAAGCVSFAFGLARSAAGAVREAAEELAARALLGAEPAQLWMPLGLSLGVVACAGVGAALVSVTVLARWVASPGTGAATAGEVALSLPTWWLAAGGLGLLVGACGLGALSARRAVGRLFRARGSRRRSALAAALAVLALLPAVGQGKEGTGTDPTSLRLLSRELAVARRALHQAERTLLASEYRVIRATAEGDLVLARLAEAQLGVDAQQVQRWRASHDALSLLRAELRAQRAAERAPGPPIRPRLRPVAGGLASGFRSDAARGGLRGFRNGIALKTRPGEIVRATAAGRVAYAAELAGAGPIVVLSHGRRTYSVYARIAEFLVARGMQVLPGEAIARAADQPGLLYFAVRERGRAIDPVRWLRESDDDGGEAPAG
jgi:murein DD-endopeptidase MepM/ murein hydrolase activator NlpD